MVSFQKFFAVLAMVLAMVDFGAGQYWTSVEGNKQKISKILSDVRSKFSTAELYKANKGMTGW